MIVFFFFNVHAVNKPFTKFVSPGCFVENPFFGFRAFLLHAYFMNSARNSTQILLMYLLKFTKAKRKQCVPMTCSPFIGQHDIISGTLAVKFSLLRKKKKKCGGVAHDFDSLERPKPSTTSYKRAMWNNNSFRVWSGLLHFSLPLPPCLRSTRLLPHPSFFLFFSFFPLLFLPRSSLDMHSIAPTSFSIATGNILSSWNFFLWNKSRKRRVLIGGRNATGTLCFFALVLMSAAT